MTKTEGRSAKVGTTIVGGQPRKTRKVLVDIPVGVERTLLLAATNPEFEQQLLAERDAALEGGAIRLRESERALLRAAPAATLRAMIDSLDLSAENLQRRQFIRAVAAGAVALSAGGCGDGSGNPPQDGGPGGKGLPGSDELNHDMGSAGCDSVSILPGGAWNGIRPEYPDLSPPPPGDPDLGTTPPVMPDLGTTPLVKLDLGTAPPPLVRKLRSADNLELEPADERFIVQNKYKYTWPRPDPGLVPVDGGNKPAGNRED